MNKQEEIKKYCGKCCRLVEIVENKEHLYSCDFCEELRSEYETIRLVNSHKIVRVVKLNRRPMGEFL